MAGWHWVTISALATGFGTLVLAIATFASVRSANRAARTAERALLQGMRPLVFPSRLSDDPVKVGFSDRHLVVVPGGQGVAETTPDAVYLALSLRNVGSGVAVLHGWTVQRGAVVSSEKPRPSVLEDFRRLTRDLYLPPGDVQFWQGAIRDRADPDFDVVTECVKDESPLTIELLYGDAEGGQRTITRYTLIPHRRDADVVWLAAVSRHWNVDRADPR